MALRAVIADTQKMFAEGMQAILTEMSMQSIKIVGIAYSMIELKKMLAYPIDLLIMDLTIAEQDSHKLISELKTENPTLRIIVLSNISESKFVRQAFIQGVDGYVLKSNHALDLLECIDKVMDGNTYLSDGLRLAPELVQKKKKKSSLVEDAMKYEDRFILKQKLTKREKQILALIVQFKSTKNIAEELYISDQTVASHRKRIMKKFGVNNTGTLIKFSLENQLV
ncbi:MAG: response regulator transcription factor [Saprospiraceae bacterium]